MTKQCIGIFGGTFDPIHQGHLTIAQDILNNCRLNQIIFVPCNIPVHREQPTVNAQKRLELLRLALTDEPHFNISTCEIDRPDPSYTIDTLHILKKQHADALFYLILGLDAFAQFSHWHKWEKILEETQLIIAHRPGITLQKERPEAMLLEKHRIFDVNALHSCPNGSIFLHEITHMDISASRIRYYLKQGQGSDIQTDLKPRVYKKIIEEHLYD